MSHVEVNTLVPGKDVKSTMTEKEKKIFFLQLYQLLRLHLCIKMRGFPTTTPAYQSFVSSHSYCIQDLKFTLQSLASILWTGAYMRQKVQKEKKTLFGNSLTSSLGASGDDNHKGILLFLFYCIFLLYFFYCIYFIF
jgi:hypothetical protein